MQIRDLIPWGWGHHKETPATKAGMPARGDDPMLALQRDINRVFDDFWRRFDQPFGALANPAGLGDPRAEVVETDKAVEVTIELPGMDEKDIEVAVTGDVLTVRGEKKSERTETDKGRTLSERYYGSFCRTIPLPMEVVDEGAVAEFSKGVLKVTLPKAPEAQGRTRKIEVKGG